MYAYLLFKFFSSRLQPQHGNLFRCIILSMRAVYKSNAARTSIRTICFKLVAAMGMTLQLGCAQVSGWKRLRNAKRMSPSVNFALTKLHFLTRQSAHVTLDTAHVLFMALAGFA